MNARQFLSDYGREEAERVAKAAGTNFAYFYQLAIGFRSPSPRLAKRLEKASGGRMKVLDLLGLAA